MGEPAAPAKLHTRDEALAAFRGIPWDSYVRAGGGAKGDGASFLTAAEVATLRAAEEATLEYSLADPAAAAAYAATLRKVRRRCAQTRPQEATPQSQRAIAAVRRTQRERGAVARSRPPHTYPRVFSARSAARDRRSARARLRNR